MVEKVNKVREPLFHVSKRSDCPKWKTCLIYFAAIVLGLIICGIVFAVVLGVNPFSVYLGLVDGNFGTKRKTWIFFRDTMLLTGVGLALIPAFKMKFWNLGGNGQITVGALAAVACMFYLGGKVPDVLVWVLMFVTGIVAAAIWAVIPAIFKAYFNTNESLFTLMMNYVSFALVNLAISKWNPAGTQSLGEITVANLPTIGKSYMYLLIDLVLLVVTAIVYVYLKYSKHGYEISVVGESQNTARYVGINVKKVIIRTLILSGAICGLVGVLLAGGWQHTIETEIADNMGFTSIIVVWLASFDPLLMLVASAFVVFLDNGMNDVLSSFGFTDNAVSELAIGIIYFCIIGCTFFIRYKVNFRKKAKSIKKEEK